ETYLNIQSRKGGGVDTLHYAYRAEINQRIDACLKYGISNYWILALSTFMDQMPSTPQEIEREIQYIRYRDPEMPGIVFYGLSYGNIDRLIDSYSYKYFIAPVVTVQDEEKGSGSFSRNGPEGAAQKMNLTPFLRPVARNIGGMNAHDVRVEALSADGKRR